MCGKGGGRANVRSPGHCGTDCAPEGTGGERWSVISAAEKETVVGTDEEVRN